MLSLSQMVTAATATSSQSLARLRTIALMRAMMICQQIRLMLKAEDNIIIADVAAADVILFLLSPLHAD